jgi:hypothetical protein
MKDHDMENNYLWDRSGEPDPEIQKLEEILGTLRYQPQPLEIPHPIQVGRRRSFFPAMAIAAALALFAVLLGLWFGFHRRQITPALEAQHDKQIDQQVNAPQPPQSVPGKQPSQAAAVQSPKPAVIEKRSAAPRNLLARNQSRGPRVEIRQPRLTPQELAEKEQVLVALRLVSAKLNLAQRKTQGVPQLNTIRNQHKIG